MANTTITSVNNTTTNYSRNFSHLVIPAEIWLHKNLSIQAKCLWAEIYSLYDKERGGCYASDAYLFEFLQIKRRRLYELFKELKNAGLLKNVSNDGRQVVRKALLPLTEDDVQIQSRSAENRTNEVQKTALYPYIDRKEEEIYNAPPSAVHPSPSSKRKKAKEQKQEVATNVWLTPTQQKQLLKKCNGSTDLVQRAYEKLADWKVGNEITGGDDYKALCKWALEAAQKEEKKKTKKQDSTEVVEKRRASIKKYCSKNWEWFKAHQIYFADCVNYVRIGNDDLYYDNNKFEELFAHIIRKLNLPNE